MYNKGERQVTEKNMKMLQDTRGRAEALPFENEKYM